MDSYSKDSTNMLYIKHMVCPRCIYLVKTELENLKIGIKTVKLGEVELTEPLDDEQVLTVKAALEKFGFEIIQNQKARLVEQLKALVLEMVRYKKDPIALKCSEYLAQETGKDYSTLSNLFSASEKITIEKYIILQKIEFVKELLTYDELNLSQIAARLGYSDVGYLSRQFKAITEYTPTEYKKLNNKGRIPLNEIGVR